MSRERRETIRQRDLASRVSYMVVTVPTASYEPGIYDHDPATIGHKVHTRECWIRREE